MENDTRAEIESLKKEMGELKALILQFTGKAPENAPKKESDEDEPFTFVHRMKGMHPDPKLDSLMDMLCKTTDEENRTGSITYLGVFASGGRQSNWIENTINTDDLLSLIENKSATAVLQCMGNNDRLTLLLAILRTPMSVVEMVEKCGFNSTGQAYHHLKTLIAANLVFELDERGMYAVRHHCVKGIIMLLAGIADLMDAKLPQPNWTAD